MPLQSVRLPVQCVAISVCKACLLPLASSATLLHISIHCYTRPLHTCIDTRTPKYSYSTHTVPRHTLQGLCTYMQEYLLALSQGNGRVHVHVSLTEGEESREYRLCAVCGRVCAVWCDDMWGGGSAILMTPPCLQIGLYYHASNFVEFGNLSITTCTPKCTPKNTPTHPQQYTPMSSLQQRSPQNVLKQMHKY